MPDQKYTAHVIIVRGFIGLFGTDDPLKVKESKCFYVFHFKNEMLTNKNVSLGENLNIEKEEPYGRGLL